MNRCLNTSKYEHIFYLAVINSIISNNNNNNNNDDDDAPYSEALNWHVIKIRHKN